MLSENNLEILISRLLYEAWHAKAGGDREVYERLRHLAAELVQLKELRKGTAQT